MGPGPELQNKRKNEKLTKKYQASTRCPAGALRFVEVVTFSSGTWDNGGKDSFSSAISERPDVSPVCCLRTWGYTPLQFLTLPPLSHLAAGNRR